MSKLHKQIKLAEEDHLRKHNLYMAQADALAELELVVEQAKQEAAIAGALLTLLLDQEKRKNHGTDRS